MAESIEVTLYTRHPCFLCDKARASMRAAASTHRLSLNLTEVDIDLDPLLRERFTNDVPVIYVGGIEAFRHRVSPDDFAQYVKLVEGTRAAGWRVVDGHHLEKEFLFPDFAQALAFTNRIGAVAEEMGHHPDIFLGWGKVRVTLRTHDAGAVTRKDFLLAEKIG